MSKRVRPTYNGLILAQLALLALSGGSSILHLRATPPLSFVGLAGMYVCGLVMFGISLYIGQRFLEFEAKRKGRSIPLGKDSRLLTLAAVSFYGLSSGFLGGLVILGFALWFTPNPTASAVGPVVVGGVMLLGYTAGIFIFAANKLWLAAFGLTLLMLGVIYTGARQLLSQLGIP
jgi:hypothetical protein